MIATQAFLGSLLFETFLYGIYSNLFNLCIYLQWRRRVHWIFQALGLVMYVTASADVAYTAWLVFGSGLNGDLLSPYLRAKYLLFVTNNMFADTLLLYRCFVVWNHRKSALIGPTLLFVAATVCGYVLGTLYPADVLEQSQIYISLTFGLNLILTTMIASRIWWVSQQARKSVQSELLRQYTVTLLILIESGFCYSIYIILVLTFRLNPTGSVVLHGGLTQVVGIVPTLILVQVGLGRCVQDLENKATTADTRDCSNTKSRASASLFTSVGPILTDGHTNTTLASGNWPGTDLSNRQSTSSKEYPLGSFTAERHQPQYSDQAKNDETIELEPGSVEGVEPTAVYVADIDYTAKEVRDNAVV